MNNEPTVYVVDDDAAIRDSLRLLIETARLRVATFANSREFLARYDADVPGCLVLDIRLPDSSGLDLQQQLVAEGIAVPVIIVTGHGDVPIAVRAMRTGAIDFIEKPYDDQVLLDRIRHAVDLDIRNRRDRAQRQDILARLALLTPREREVLDGVVGGFANKQIAGDLRISTKTVEAHRAHVMEKMRVDSLAELVRLVQIAGVARDPAGAIRSGAH